MFLKDTILNFFESLHSNNCQLIRYLFVCITSYFNYHKSSLYASFFVTTLPGFIRVCMTLIPMVFVALGIFYPHLIVMIGDLIVVTPTPDLSTPDLINQASMQSPVKVITIIEKGVVTSKEVKIVGSDYYGLFFFIVPILIVLL